MRQFTLTRLQVAARLGISTSSVRRLEDDRLHTVQDDRGVWRFDPAELEGIEPRPPRPSSDPAQAARANETRLNGQRGRLAARVFRMFERYATLPQIVVLTRQPPEVIRELYREWSTSLDEGNGNAGARPVDRPRDTQRTRHAQA